MVTKVNKNIDFLVDDYGNLVGSRNPRSQTSNDASFADKMLATLATDASGNVTGMLGPSGGYVLGTNGFIPAANDYAGIMAAYNAAVAAGGGTVQLLPVTYTITQSLPITSGVSYVGSMPVTISPNSSAPDISAILSAGTLFNVSAGVIAFAGRTEAGAVFTGSVTGTTLTVSSIVADVSGTVGILDIGSRPWWTGNNESYIVAQLSGTPNRVGTYQLNVAQTTNASITDGFVWRCQYIAGVTIENIGFIGGKKAIQCGAYNTLGASFSRFANLYAYNTTDVPFDHYNFEHTTFYRNFSYSCGHGPRYVMYANNPMGGLGNSKLEKIYNYASNKPLAMGIVLGSMPDNPGYSGLGDAYEVQNNHYNRTKQSAVFTSDGTANISVPNAALLPVHTVVRFTSTVLGFWGSAYVSGGNSNRQAYFVTSSNTSTNKITLSTNPSGTNFVPTAGTITGEWFGLPSIIIGGSVGGAFGATFKDFDVEGPGSTILINRIAQGRIETAFASNQDESSFVVRQSSGVTFLMPFGSTLDSAGTNSRIEYFGIFPNVMNIGSTQAIQGVGDDVSRSVGFALRLGIYTSSQFLNTLVNKSPGGGSDWTYPELPFGVCQTYSTTAVQTVNLGIIAGNYTYTGTGAGTWTWGQGMGTSMKGYRMTFKNQGTGALTITLGASDGTFDGMTGGVSLGKSMLLAAPTTTALGGCITMVCAQTGASTYQWEVESLVNATLV